MENFLLGGSGGSLLNFVIFIAWLGLAAGWVLNIVGAVFAWRIGRTRRPRFITHIIGFFIYPLGMVMGLIWLFKWRKSDNTTKSLDVFPPPPPPSGREKRRSPLVLGGMIFAISPLLFSLVASIFVDNALDESTPLGAIPWLMFLTLPIGFVIAIVGLATGNSNSGNQNQ